MQSEIRGQKRADLILNSSIAKGRIASAYLFYGASGVGKFSKALEFAMSINCLETKVPCRKCSSCQKFLNFSHPDFIYLFPSPNLKMDVYGNIKDSNYLKEYKNYLENKKKTPYNKFFFTTGTELRIDSIHMLSHRINLSANQSKYKVCIIEDAHKLNTSAANAFLKTLEEPPDNCVIILTSHKMDSILPTIVSRCQKIPFSSLTSPTIKKILIKNYDVNEKDGTLYSKIALGNISRAIRMSKNTHIASREYAKEFLEIIFSGNDLAFIDFMNKFGSTKYKNELIDIINYMTSYLSDIYIYSNGSNHLTNIDDLDFLHNIAISQPHLSANLPSIVEFLENMSKINNLNPTLIISGIYAKISRFI